MTSEERKVIKDLKKCDFKEMHAHFVKVMYDNVQYLLCQQTNSKQLLDEVEHDIMNYQNRVLCYVPKPKAEADNTDMRF